MKKHILKEGIEIIVPDGASMVFGVVDKEEKKAHIGLDGCETVVFPLIFDLLKTALSKRSDCPHKGFLQASHLAAGREMIKEALDPDIEITISYNGKKLEPISDKDFENALDKLFNRIMGDMFIGGKSDAKKD